MTAKIAKYWMLKDITSRTPSAVVAAQGSNPEDLSWLTVDNVPFHCMYSLSNLLCGADDHPEFPDRISIGYGDGRSISDYGIELSEVAQEANSNTLAARQEDSPGSTFLILKALVRFKDDPAEDQVQNIDLRIQFLLDSAARSIRYGITNQLLPVDGSTIIDRTVNPQAGVLYRYWKSITPTNTRQTEVLFFQDINRIFLG
jgi:hypothetical protein